MPPCWTRSGRSTTSSTVSRTAASPRVRKDSTIVSGRSIFRPDRRGPDWLTAQKREQSLQDVPISVVAVSGEHISDQGYGELADITASLPNVTVNQAALGDVLFIRGVGSGFNVGFEQSVATFIDGVYFGRGLQSRNAFLDIERVEVLRGPQVTFFGNNAIAGALNIVITECTATTDSRLPRRRYTSRAMILSP